MITNPQILEYLRAIEPEQDPLIKGIEQEALEHNIPIIKKETQQLLKFVLAFKRPKHILEVGTAVGFSAILMSDYLESGGQITTIERSPYMIQRAKSNILRVKKENLIHIIEQEAEEALENLKGPYDVIFMDAAKGQYLNFLPHCIRLLVKGGILISDNVLQDGNIAKSRYSVPRRQRTIHTRMRDYLWELNHHSLLDTTILPIGDGVTLSYMKDNPPKV